MITGQTQNIVFDGTRPLLTSLTPVRGEAFPWLVQLTTVAGDVIDLSSTTSGTTTIPWGATFGISRDYGNSSTLVLSVVASMVTAGGSQISLPGNGPDGKVLVYVSATDTLLLPDAATDSSSGVCVFTLELKDLAGIPYVVARGQLYPQEKVGIT